MKIGILTFHRAYNYGAMLQAYALHHVLVQKGHDVEFISYRQSKIENAYKIWLWTYNKSRGPLYNLKSLLSNILTIPRRIKRRKSFNKFSHKYLPETRKYSRKDLLSEELNYDAVFFGSDQIWTTRFLGTFDDIYWGNIHIKDGYKIAYAPSMELTTLSETEKNYIKQHINNFDSLSARETYTANLLEYITGQSVQAVVDPTLLCKFDDYKSLISSSKHIPSYPYVLVYQVGHFKQVREIAQNVANQLCCEIIEIGDRIYLHKDSTYKDTYGPEDFVALIANATFVISCSFHGTVFSVNFHKPFYSVLIPGLDLRAKSFLTQINLLECGIRNADEIDINSVMTINYNEVDIVLDKLRCSSMAYINQSLNR